MKTREMMTPHQIKEAINELIEAVLERRNTTDMSERENKLSTWLGISLCETHRVATNLCSVLDAQAAKGPSAPAFGHPE